MALEYQQMKDELNGARKEIDALRKQNQHLTGIQTIQTNDLFGRSTEKTEDILSQVIQGDLPTKDPLSEDAAEPVVDKEDAAAQDRIVKGLRRVGLPVRVHGNA